MPKITPREKGDTVVIKTSTTSKKKARPGAWWNAGSKKELCETLLSTAAFLKEQNQYRYRQASIYARLYGNLPLGGGLGANLSRLNSKSQFPIDRPTMSVITSCVDTLTSRISQSKPLPTFLTDEGDYRQRKLAKQMNSFTAGELYQTKAHEKGELILRDSAIWGTGVLKVLEDRMTKRVAIERRLATQLVVDSNESFLGDPRQLYEFALVDKQMLKAMFPGNDSLIEKAEQAYPEAGDSDETASDLVMVVEAWRLPSGPDSKDGLHAIACTSGHIDDEAWEKARFPFSFLHYSPAQVGFWGQGLAERQMGTQAAINRTLMTIDRSINLVGVPRVFVEDGSKVVKSQLNNEIGAIVTYRGTKPEYSVAPCVPMELYSQLERLIQFAYQQEGISQLSSTSQKPAGLNSGEALREYDDIQSDRFAWLSKRYNNLYVDLDYLIIDTARDIAKRDGKYQTVYPGKDGTKQVDLPASKLLDDPFVIQCLDASFLPKDPSGRLQKVTELMQAGIYSAQEGRRLLGSPDTAQVDNLENAAEERILQVLDQIVEDGKYTPPDPFMDLQMALKLVTQYYNLYSSKNLEESRCELLRNFSSQVKDLIQAATPPPPPETPGAGPQAVPQSQPVSDLMQNAPQGA